MKKLNMQVTLTAFIQLRFAVKFPFDPILVYSLAAKFVLKINPQSFTS